MCKKLVLGIFCIVFFSSCSLFKKTSTQIHIGSFTIEENQEMVSSSKQFLGIPYRNGGTDLDGMDCSGLLYTLYLGHSFIIPRTTTQQVDFGYLIDKKSLNIGDWVFFKTNGSTLINHVGLVTLISSNHIMFIHASTSKGIREDDLFQNYWAQAYAKAIRPFRRLN